MKKFLFLAIIIIFTISLFIVNTAFTQDNILSQKVSQLADKLAFAVEGDVLGVSGDIVYINLGQESGVVEGIEFEVVRLDRDHPFKMGDKIIGYPETPVGQIEITAVRKEMSLAKITEKLMDIREGDRVYQQMKKVTRVAITEFTYGEEFNSFTRNVQDILYTNLIQRGMTVVEREKMEEVMEELSQTFSGMIDISTAAQIGKMLGVEAVIVGTVADMGNSVDLRARLVDVEKGAAITAATIAVTKDPTIGGLLNSGIRRTIYGKKESTVQKETKEGWEVKVEGVSFKFIDCKRKGEDIIFEVLITSDEDKYISLFLNDFEDNYRRTRFIDAYGNECIPNKIEFGDYEVKDGDGYMPLPIGGWIVKKFLYVTNRATSKVPIKAVITFNNVTTEARSIALLEIYWRADDKEFLAQLRDIPITE